MGHLRVFFINSGLLLTIKNFVTLPFFHIYSRIRNHQMIQLSVYISFLSLEISLSRLSQCKHFRTSTPHLIPQHSTIIICNIWTTYKSFNSNMDNSYLTILHYHYNFHNKVICNYHSLPF